jgi:fumarate reductase subunit D
MEQNTAKFNPAHPDPTDVEKNKLMAAISYLGVLCLVPLFLKKSSPYVQFHAKQGLVLFIAEIVISFVNIIPFLGQLAWLVAVVVFLIVSIKGIVKAWNGVCWKIPVISDYAKKIELD